MNIEVLMALEPFFLKISFDVGQSRTTFLCKPVPLYRQRNTLMRPLTSYIIHLTFYIIYARIY
jgi:hypothetical protein